MSHHARNGVLLILAPLLGCSPTVLCQVQDTHPPPSFGLVSSVSGQGRGWFILAVCVHHYTFLNVPLLYFLLHCCDSEQKGQVEA